MDQKKKIIAIAVFVVFMSAIGLYAKYTFFSDDEEEEKEFTITVPEVNEEDLDSVSKLEGYDKDSYKLKTTEELLKKREEKKEARDTYGFNPFRTNPAAEDTLSDPADEFEKMRLEEQLKAKEELEMLLKMQEEMNTQVANQVPANYYQPAPVPAAPDPVNEGLPDIEEDPGPLTLTEKWDQQKDRGNPFRGVSGFTKDEGILDLIPAETVDQGQLIEGSTVAIRLKQTLRIPDSKIAVPKNAVLYGKASFDGKFRMHIDIVSYKTNRKLYPVNLNIYDFDGREGVHLGTNTWPKVPGRVAKEVFRFVRQRGTNPAAFGGGNNIDGETVRTITLLSTINEVLEELVNRKRVFMPRKYHLWINVVKEDKN
jgi:hypothetical protein